MVKICKCLLLFILLLGFDNILLAWDLTRAWTLLQQNLLNVGFFFTCLNKVFIEEKVSNVLCESSSETR